MADHWGATTPAPRGCMSIARRFIAGLHDALYSSADTRYVASKYVLQTLGISSSRIMSPHKPLSREQGKKVDALLGQFADVLEG